jgi:hypothetical protein
MDRFFISLSGFESTLMFVFRGERPGSVNLLHVKVCSLIASGGDLLTDLNGFQGK